MFASRRHNRGGDGFTHRVELVIGGNLLDQSFAVVLKQHKITNVIEQKCAVKEALHDGLQLPVKLWFIVFVSHGFPRQEAFFIGGQRANTRVLPVAHHQRFVADKQVAEFVFIGLQLVKRSPDIGIGINRAF